MTILELLPAIDVTGGQAVRLSSGSIDEGAWGSPIDVAHSFDEAGARWVEPVHPLGSKSHLVASLAYAEAIGVVAPDVEVVEAGQELAVVPLVG